MFKLYRKRSPDPIVFSATDLCTPKLVNKGNVFVIENTPDKVDSSCCPALYTLDNLIAANQPLHHVPTGVLPMSDDALDSCVQDVLDHFNTPADE
nr:MAG TPA: hypothetical protein [Microviridae sp.]